MATEVEYTLTMLSANFITSDTQAIYTEAAEKFTAAQVRLAGQASQYAGLDGIDAETSRKLDILRTMIVVPAPSDPL